MAQQQVGDALAASMTESVSYSKDQQQVVLLIDWTIPKFSALKTQTTPINSTRTAVGDSAWSIQLYPLYSQDKVDKSIDGTAAFLVHSSAYGRPLSGNVNADFSIKLLDANGHIQPKDALPNIRFPASHVFTPESNNCGYAKFFSHIDVWGPNPKMFLVDDALKLRTEIKYTPVKASPGDRADAEEPLKKRLRVLLETEEGKDVILVSADKTERTAHSTMLSLMSPVFKKASLSRSTNGAAVSKERYELPDVSTQTLDVLLHHVYCESIEDLADHAQDVLVAAENYELLGLKMACERVLAEGLTNGNAAQLLLLACDNNATALHHVAVNLRNMTSAGQFNKIVEEGTKDLAFEVLSAVAQWGVR